jgi:FkbM family methyltransferase
MVPSVRAVFRCDGVSTHIILDGLYEKYELEVLETEIFKHVDPSSTCLDIGANIGNHSNAFSKYFARVIAFEPNPMVHAVLLANTIGSNIIAVPKGVSDAHGDLCFEQDFANLGASRIVKSDGSTMTKIKVVPLDDLIEEYALSDVTFIKIDVENHELEALRGATRFVSKYRPIIAMEAFFAAVPERGKEIEDLLRDAGYKHFYKLIPRSNFVNRLEGTRFSAKKGVLRAILPEKMRKSLKLHETFEVTGHDHQLLIVSEGPLLNQDA